MTRKGREGSITPPDSALVKASDLFIEYLDAEYEEARKAGALGYMARALVQATIPHARVVGNEFIRSNGAYSITILAPSKFGLPYGSVPRLLLAWVTTEAVRTKSPELELGPTLSSFMRQLDLMPTGGRWGTIPRLKKQMESLFNSDISITYSGRDRGAGMGMRVAKEYLVWWDHKHPHQSTLWMSTVTLSRDFFDEITDRPVPVSMKALKYLKRSPFALDIYTWLTYRNSYMRQPTRIPWDSLQLQFGAGYPFAPEGRRNFKKNFLRSLIKVSSIYPEAGKLREESGCLLLTPGKPHIPKRAIE